MPQENDEKELVAADQIHVNFENDPLGLNTTPPAVNDNQPDDASPLKKKPTMRSP